MKTIAPLFAAFLLAALSSAAPAFAETAAADGEAAFAARCGRCHQVSRLQGYLARRGDDAARTRDLEAFLARHHAPDQSERQAIIAWLLSQRAPSP
ncbi:MAG TPA: hypothetical protein VFS04_05755 [Alphaproteobacteria bacterium]|nr:hypothetical protein [Alphaproteobacteria bacterium]